MLQVGLTNGMAGPAEVLEAEDQGITRGDMETLAQEFETMDDQGYHLALVDCGERKPRGRKPRQRLVWHDFRCTALGGISLRVEPLGMAFPPPPEEPAHGPAVSGTTAKGRQSDRTRAAGNFLLGLGAGAVLVALAYLVATLG